MRRGSLLILVLVLGAAATVASAAVTSGGGARSASKPKVKVIRLTALGTGGFQPPSGHPGSTLGFTGGVRSGDGKLTGRDVGVCTVFQPTELLCNVHIVLSNGQIAAQGILAHVNHNAVITVIGGTGAYTQGRGTMSVTDVGVGTTEVTKFTVKLTDPD